MKSLLDPIPPQAEPRPSRARWDRYVLGLASPSEREELEVLLERCEESRQQVALIRAEQSAFRESRPSTAAFLALLEERSPSESWLSRLRRWWKHPAIVAPLSACAAFLLFFSMSGRERQGDRSSPVRTHPGVIVKGQPELQVYRFRASARALVKSGQRFTKGDVLGFTYRAAGQKYLFVVLKDQRGGVSWLYPKDGSQSIPLASQGKLTDSVELDGSKGAEQLFAFFSKTPLTRAEVKALIQRPLQSGALPNRPSVFVRRFVLNKH